MNYAIILAGGKGSRFWPLSRELEPKQFLNVYSDKPLIEESINRISPLIKKENIYIASSRVYKEKINRCSRKLRIPLSNILLEPSPKNTFAPIAVLSKYIGDCDPGAVIISMPSDHFIKHTQKFLKLLNKGIEIVKRGYIVALGIPPTRPETGFGYIRAQSKINDFYLIDRFIEKPDLARAKKFVRDKRYYWNGGIFIFTPRLLLEEIKKFVPGIYSAIKQLKNKKDFKKLWPGLPSISIDYAIMEKTRRIALLPVECGWSDLGSWEAVMDIAKKDKNGNVFSGRHIDIGSRNTFALPQKRLIATLGLDNIIIVDTKDALLVCRRDMSQGVKKIAGILKQKNFKGQL
ncbi:MAG: sugar phosphate nucleotidyltransferase [Candidatus Omnitrophica bacterium]|jgi:mannose-1-phosphate guanylyltransferase/mannose-6-phosphate isomerase|nr:sugar phosphate nucleotidyltransferase [Candidatus Omnitrophota bacterium]